MQDFILWSHVISGSLVLLMGLIIMRLPKGGKIHTRLGWIYVIAMWWVCISAFLSIAFYRFSMFLMVIGILTFYSTFHGIRVIRRAKTFKASWYDYLVSGTVALSGIGLMVYAIYVVVQHPNNLVLAGLSMLFGFFILSGAVRDLKQYLSDRPDDRNWWLYQHISSIGGSYIAAVTAFAVQNADLFSITGSIAWLPWVLPGVAGGLIISRITTKIREKNGQVAT